MRFSRNWIAAYTDLPEDSVLHERMSMLGLVVDDARPTGDDVTLDLDFPSNRPDAMNHWGIARELALASGAAIDRPLPEVTSDATVDTAGLIRVEVEDPACPRFVARAAVNVIVGPSPAWLCARLESIGLRPINNVVDITNFVMWELGRPMHAYDLDQLAGGLVQVRRAREGETLVTLDDVERKLGPEDLVIADAERPIGLAGVMGGSTTAVNDSTRRVLLECAFFDAVTVRRMAGRHGMHTDASHRFERGMSAAGIEEALHRAAGLLVDCASARVSGALVDVRTAVPPLRSLTLRNERIAGLLGVEVAAPEVERILTGLDFRIERSGADFEVTVPAPRTDIEREVDLIEELARFYGYDRFPNTLPALRRVGAGGLQPELQAEAGLRDTAAAMGFWDSLTYVFGSAPGEAAFAPAAAELVRLRNPLSEAFGVLRRNLTPGLLTVAARNHNVGEASVRLFEIGRTFAPGDADQDVVERRRAAILMTGPVSPAHFQVAPRATDFTDLKGAMESLWARARWPALRWEPAEVPGLQPGSSATITCEDAAIGFAGRVAADAAHAAGLDLPVWVGEVDIDAYVRRAAADLRIEPLPRFPQAERDVSLLVADGTSYAAVEGVRSATAGTPLVAIRLLDQYAGADLPESKMVWTLRLTYRADDRTLTTDEIEATHATVVEQLEKALAASRR